MNEGLENLSGPDLRTLASAIRSSRLTPPFSGTAVGRFSGDSSEIIAQELEDLRKEGFTSGQIARVLELFARRQGSKPQSADFLELVMTGPEATGISRRDTGVVVRDLLASATRSVLIVGYAFYQGQSIFGALAQKMLENPQLSVVYCVDIRRENDTSKGSEIVREFLQRFQRFNWPKGLELPAIYFDPRGLELEKEKRAALHAKCIVVDGQVAFISSANFTQAAQNKNIEVGVLVKNALIAEKVGHYFHRLIEDGALVAASSKK